MSRTQATEDEIDRFGPAGSPVPPIGRGVGPTGVLLMLTSVATMGVAVWLFAVIGSVLPSRDPAHIQMWRGVAIAFLGYGGLSWAYLCAGPRSIVLRGMILVISAAAVGAGLYGVVAMARAADRGGHFEGYVVLMGLILCGHGVTAILHALMIGRRSRRLGIA